MVYVTNQLDNSVSVIDGNTNEVMETIEVEATPRRIVVLPEKDLVYVSNQLSNSISVIDEKTMKVIDSIQVEQPFELSTNPNTQKIYSTYYGTSQLSIIDESTRVKSSEPDAVWIGIIIAIIIGATLSIFIKKLKRTEKIKN